MSDMSSSFPRAIDSDAEHRARLAEERRLLDQAEAEAERDGTVPFEEVEAWALSLLTDHPLPRPRPRHG
ncbi:MAG: hypothetical protein ACREFY_19425 [Acetobacteraceae bacterium]